MCQYCAAGSPHLARAFLPWVMKNSLYMYLFIFIMWRSSHLWGGFKVFSVSFSACFRFVVCASGLEPRDGDFEALNSGISVRACWLSSRGRLYQQGNLKPCVVAQLELESKLLTLGKLYPGA